MNFVGFLVQLGLQNPPKINPKSIQELSKIQPNLQLNFDGCVDRFFIDFFIQHDMAYIAKITKNRRFFKEIGIFAAFDVLSS